MPNALQFQQYLPDCCSYLILRFFPISQTDLVVGEDLPRQVANTHLFFFGYFYVVLFLPLNGLLAKALLVIPQ
jgi:hypothetical protein